MPASVIATSEVETEPGVPSLFAVNVLARPILTPQPKFLKKTGGQPPRLD